MNAAHSTNDSSSSPPDGVAVRPALVAAMAFMEAARRDSFGFPALLSWLEEHLVQPGLMGMPPSVHEPGVGTVPLEAAPNRSWTASRDARLQRIASTARVRVAVHLAGLVARPSDDRFISAAIFAGRVQRVSGERGAWWHATPNGADRLSDLVLGLFVADVLSNREDYDAQLCVCDVCGKIGFALDAVIRSRCAQHRGEQAP